MLQLVQYHKSYICNQVRMTENSVDACPDDLPIIYSQ